MGWAINNTIDTIRGAITAGEAHPEIFLEAVYEAARKSSRGIKDSAASRGTSIHKAIEESLGRSDEGTTPIVEAALLCDWLRRDGLVPRYLERRVYSRLHRYSGTFDCIATDQSGKLVLLDWKTSKSIYPEFRLQTAAYVKAFEEETGETIDRRIIVRIGEDGVHPYTFGRETLRGDWSAFLGAKALYERLQKIEKELKKH